MGHFNFAKRGLYYLALTKAFSYFENWGFNDMLNLKKGAHLTVTSFRA